MKDDFKLVGEQRRPSSKKAPGKISGFSRANLHPTPYTRIPVLEQLE
jgi:hypothetical protein